MKKLLALFVMMSFAAAANADMIVPMIGIDSSGTFNQSGLDFSYSSFFTGYNSNSSVSPNIDVGVEYLLKSDGVFNYGAGLEYLFQRGVSVSGASPSFGFTPIYLTGQYGFWNSRAFKPYVKMNLGWNVAYTGNSDFTQGANLLGTMYWAIGIGGRIYKDTIIASLMYSMYTGSHSGVNVSSIDGSSNAITITDTYSVIGLKFGYCFDLCGKRGK